MRKLWIPVATIAITASLALLPRTVVGQKVSITETSPVIAPDWKAAIRASRTRLTLQVVVNPPLRRGSPIHDPAWQSIYKLDASDARFAMWYPYPHLAVAEIAPPTEGGTSWDFSYMDPLVDDFFKSTAKQPSVLTISTIPQWMFETQAPVAVPDDPDKAVWDYEQGAQLRDDSLEEVSRYFERVAQWYIQGSFIDELGQRHPSGHHYRIDYWEVLNEPEYEHGLSAEYYTRIYDAVVSKLRPLSPRLHFVGMSLAEPSEGKHFFEYFLDPSHHAAGIPLDAISYHFYALGHDGETPDAMATSFFSQADHFNDTVQMIESVRTRLSPRTETQINEAGCIAANDVAKTADSMNGKDIPASYWNLCGAVFAYLYGHLAAEGIDVVGASQLLGFPGQYPSVSLLDWTHGLPNARYRVLQLLLEECHPGDLLVSTQATNPRIYVQAFLTSDGRKKILLVNKSSEDTSITVPGENGGSEVHVDEASKNLKIRRHRVESDSITLHGFSVMTVTLDGRVR